MNMKSLLAAIFCTACCSCFVTGGTANVPPAQQRAATLGLAASLVKSLPQDEVPQIDSSTNPFKEGVTITEPDGPRLTPMNDHDLLALLAEQLNPTGTFVMGGEPILLFGQKKIKVGDKLPLSYEGAIYYVEIVEIKRISFTISLNQEKFSRPIEVNTASKPGKNP